MVDEDQTQVYDRMLVPEEGIARDIASRKGNILEQLVSYAAQVKQGDASWAEVLESNTDLGRDLTYLVILEHSRRVDRAAKNIGDELVDQGLQNSIDAQETPTVAQLMNATKSYFSPDIKEILSRGTYSNDAQTPSPDATQTTRTPEPGTTERVYDNSRSTLKVDMPTAVEELASRSAAVRHPPPPPADATKPVTYTTPPPSATEPILPPPRRDTVPTTNVRAVSNAAIGESIEDVLKRDAERDNYRNDTEIDPSLFQDIAAPVDDDTTVIAPEGFESIAKVASDRRSPDAEGQNKGRRENDIDEISEHDPLDLPADEEDNMQDDNRDEDPEEYEKVQIIYSHDPETTRRLNVTMSRNMEATDRFTAQLERMRKSNGWKSAIIAGLTCAVGALGMYAWNNERDQSEIAGYKAQITSLEETIGMQHSTLTELEDSLAEVGPKAARMDNSLERAISAYREAGKNLTDTLRSAEAYSNTGKFRGPVKTQFSEQKPIFDGLVRTFEHDTKRGITFLNDQRAAYVKANATMQSYINLSNGGICSQAPPVVKKKPKKRKQVRRQTVQEPAQPTEEWGEIIE